MEGLAMNDFFDKLLRVDWQSVFVPTESLLEIIIRGTIMYLAMFALLRVFRRQAGSLSIADLLVIVIIADAAQNGMADDSKSVTESLVLICTIVFWDYFLDFLGFKSRVFERVIEPEKLEIIKDGKLLRRNMKKEMLTEDEVLSQMRQNGVEDVSEIKIAYLESDGHFSFIKKDSEEEDSQQKSNRNKKKIVN
jgi:uncharacterized membrane protein YcaP (DUF421 family)